jgi:ATP-binding cassette subfamily B protein
MSQVQDFISMVFLLTALIAFNPWLILLSAGYYSLILGESYFNSKNYALSRSQTRKKRTGLPVIWELVTKLQRK